MKKLTLLFISVLTVSVYGQDVVIPKKANTIIISDTLSRDQFYNSITGILFESGYGILSSDKEQGFITTTERSVKDGTVKLNIMVKDQKVILRGDFKYGINITMYGVTSTSTWTEIAFYGMKKSPIRIAWDEMVKVSDQIPGSKEYIVK